MSKLLSKTKNNPTLEMFTKFSLWVLRIILWPVLYLNLRNNKLNYNGILL